MMPPETETVFETAAVAPSNVLPVDVYEEPVPVWAPSRGLLATTKKYANIFRASLKERMAYRGDFLLGTILRFLPMVTTILLWRSVYAGSGQKTLGTFDFSEMIAYLLLRIAARLNTVAMPALRFAELAGQGLFTRRPIATIDKPPPVNPSKPAPKSSPNQLAFCYA